MGAIYIIALPTGVLVSNDSFTEINPAPELNNNYHTRDGKFYGRYTLKSILSNPVYCVAGKVIYKYLAANGYSIYTEQRLFNGHTGNNTSFHRWKLFSRL